MKGRLEDRRLLTGRGRFISDWNFPNQAHAAFLRSDRAHAEIVSVDAGSALAAPGVLLVLTGKDVAEAGYKSIPANLGVKDRFGEPLKKPPRPVLAQGKVRHVGECVACVVAESAQLAQDAAELIAVEYRDLPAVTVADKALAPGAPQLHAELPGNLSFDWVAGDEAATEAAFRAADRVVRLALDNPRMVGNPMEPRACAGTYDAATQKYALYACTQGTAGMRGQLVYTMGVPDDKIDVIAEDVGGGFGVRFNMYPEYSAVLLAAKKTGRPVKWTGSRSEVFLSDEQGRDVASTSELALDSSGKFLALRFSYIADLGAYLAPTGPFINTQGVVACLTGIYAVPAACARVKLAVTNKAPGAAYRGAGRPVMSYMLERLVDEAAVELGIDPAELRFGADGGVTLYAVSHSHGQGHETSYAQIVSSVLGVPVEKFRLRNGDPAVRLVGNATGGSRSLLGVGSVMQLAAKQVVEKSLALAARDLEAAAADIEFADGSYRIRGTDRAVSLAALAKKYAGTANALDVKTEGKFGVTFPNGCHVAEVEIEPETGIAEIVRFTAVDDAGNIVNHQIVEGQMQGGITQGAGQVFGEHAVYDPDTGQLLSGSFMDYPMPRAGLVEGLAIHEHPVPTATNPLGAKGVGEAGGSGSLPALMNAVSDALRQAGVTRFDMPATPDRLWRAIRDAKAGGR